MNKAIHLRKFNSHELILDESETRTILKFFWPEDSVATSVDESLTVTDSVRGFAQALLVEAIDASYRLGFIEAVFRSSANPKRGAVKVFKSFGKRAIKRWFKHADAIDLESVRIYEFVRVELSRAFRVRLKGHVNGIAHLDRNRPVAAFVSYSKFPVVAKVWG